MCALIFVFQILQFNMTELHNHVSSPANVYNKWVESKSRRIH